MQPISETERARTAAPTQRLTLVTPVPPEIKGGHRGWLSRWPSRSYLELGALDTAPGSARAHVGAVLREWGLGSIADECCLIVSELVSNAVFATRAEDRPDPVRMWMLGNHAGALFLVWDATMPPPVLRAAADDAEDGRGLTIVDTVSAHRWGSYHADGHRGGKVVWAHVTAPAGRPALPARITPSLPAAGKVRARNRAPVPVHVLAQVKAALERMPPAPPVGT